MILCLLAKALAGCGDDETTAAGTSKPDDAADSARPDASDAATADVSQPDADADVGDVAQPDGADAALDVAADAATELDSDGDTISDTDEGRTSATDTDGDVTPDYLDTDSDGDGIPDSMEAGDSDIATPPVDSDDDGDPDFRDLESDGDCRADADEAPVVPPADSDDDGIADYRDRDSDNDGLGDGVEDENCNGSIDTGETSPFAADTDGDGASDLVEASLATDGTNAADNPAANGEIVIVAAPSQAPAPPTSTLSFSPALQALDLYVLLDRSGSMLSEITTIRANLSTVVSNLACPPLGTGTPGACIPDLWAGAGAIGYTGSGVDAYRNVLDLQPLPNFSAVPTTEPAGCCSEPLNFALWASITGFGSAGATGCGISGVPARASCTGSPAQNAGYSPFGYPCFRSNALPVLVLATDEPPISTSDTNKCPSWASIVRPAMLSRGAKVVGILGSGAPAAVQIDLQTMATDTGAVDARNGNAPLVFNGADANAASAIQSGIHTLLEGLPLDLSVLLTDDPADSVDAVTAFVSRVQTHEDGTSLCTSGLTTADTNGDTYNDSYMDVVPMTPVCWQIVAKQNDIVQATTSVQIFHVTLTILGDSFTSLAERDVYFIVPPLPL